MLKDLQVSYYYEKPLGTNVSFPVIDSELLQRRKTESGTANEK